MDETQIGAAGDVVDVPAGRTLTAQGAIGHEFVVLLEGEATVEQDGRTVGRLGPGDFLGEIALLTRTRRTATVRTTAPSRLLVVAEREFRSLVDRIPAFSAQVWAAAAKRLAR